MFRIKEWSSESGSGRVQGPHLDLPFDRRAAVGTSDFHVGEEVDVRLSETNGGWLVERVTPQHARQPNGTELAVFAELNRMQLWDFEVVRYEGDVLTVIAGEDLMYSHKAEIRFREVSWFSGATHFSHALFRAASEEEVSTLPADQRADGRAFAIVTEHGNGADGPVHFIVAQYVEVELATVFHYEREGLNEGERMADWVIAKRGR